jgi:hypothetical protein
VGRRPKPPSPTEPIEVESPALVELTCGNNRFRRFLNFSATGTNLEIPLGTFAIPIGKGSSAHIRSGKKAGSMYNPFYRWRLRLN